MLPPGNLFGLFVALSNVSIPLTSVHYGVNVKSFASHITINQTYKNVESTDLECVYGFPINDQAAIVGLTVTIDNRTLISQFKKKDEAFKEYTEALARGDGAYLLDQSDRSDDTFVLSVGRLPPGKECTVSISYVATLESITETKMRLTIPTALFPRYNPTPHAPKGVAPPESYQSNVSYKATLSGHVDAIDIIQNLTSATHPLSVNNVGPKEATFTFAAEQEPLDRDLHIDIEIKNNPEHYVEIENTGDGKYTAMYAFVPRFKAASPVQTEIIFVVDCSGSMTAENRIGDAKRAMQIFLRSIPEGNYFNFYRFGSTFKSLFNQSELYSGESFAKAKEYAEQTSASLGGTEVLEPLQAIYSKPPRPGFSRQIFLLTDGEVTNTEQVIALVRANAANTRLFSFGLGNSPSRSLVNGVAAAGNGKAEFIRRGENLEGIVARQLNRAIQPAVKDASIDWHGVKNAQQVPAVLPPVFKGDRQLVYAIFEHDGAVNAVTFVQFKKGSEVVSRPFVLLPSSANKAGEPFLHKLAARELIRQVEDSAPAPDSYGYHGSQQARGPVPTNDEIKEKISAISLTYGVLSKYVSLVAVEQRTADESANASGAMELKEIPIQLSQAPRDSSRHLYAMAPMSMPMAYGYGGGGGAGLPGLPGPPSLQKSGYISNTYAQSSSFSGQQYDSDDDSSNAFTSVPSADTQLNQILTLQQWNGVWKFSADLERLTNFTESEIKKAALPVQAQLSDDLVSTIFVSTLITHKFSAQRDVWSTIVSKTTAVVDKQTDQAAVLAVQSALLALIQSK